MREKSILSLDNSNEWGEIMLSKANNNRMTAEVLEAYKVLAPHLPDITFNELSTGITDTEKFVAYYKGRYLDLGIKPGDPIKPGSPVDEAIRNKKRVIKHIPKAFIGIPYIITANPIFDGQGKVIGAIATGTSTEKEVLIKDTSTELSSAIEQINSAVNEMVLETEKFTHANEELLALSLKTQERVADTNDILEYIKDIGSEIKVLGINASIEASRAGNHGLGFKVVASEIQKLSDNSLKSVKRIEETLRNAQNEIGAFVRKAEEFNKFVHAQMAMTEETLATTDQLNKMSENLLASVKGIV